MAFNGKTQIRISSGEQMKTISDGTKISMDKRKTFKIKISIELEQKKKTYSGIIFSNIGKINDIFPPCKLEFYSILRKIEFFFKFNQWLTRCA